MPLKNVGLTGVVTLFYGELCSQMGFIPVKDPIRNKIYNYYKTEFEQNKTDFHHLLSMDQIEFQGIIDVAYRNYRFDQIVQQLIWSRQPTEVVNLGCGMDTRYFRLNGFTGHYYDVDFKDVIREKKKLIETVPNYHFIETSSIVHESFLKDELVLLSDNPIVMAEGVFCYIQYPSMVKFVRRLFEKYPKAILVCDVFLFDKHLCFDDLRSRILLRFPENGEQIYRYISKIPFLKNYKKHADCDGKKELSGITLSESEHGCGIIVNYNGRSYCPQYWIGTYRRVSDYLA